MRLYWTAFTFFFFFFPKTPLDKMSSHHVCNVSARMQTTETGQGQLKENLLLDRLIINTIFSTEALRAPGQLAKDGWVRKNDSLVLKI